MVDDVLAAKCFSALGHTRRLDVYRLLVKTGPNGLKAGEIAEAFQQVPSTMSSHLRILADAGLVHSVRKGREIHFAADPTRMEALLRFLAVDCAGGHPEQVDRLLVQLLPDHGSKA